MVSQWAFLLLVVGCAPLIFGYEGHDVGLRFFPGSQNSKETCWERCFQVEDTPFQEFREVYDDFYRMGMEARRLKNVYSVNGTAILLDSTLAEFHGDSANNLDNEDRAEAIWTYQRDLAVITILLMEMDESHNPFYLAQFDEESGYTCEEHQCLDSCEAASVISSHAVFNLNQLKTDPTSHRDGNIEAACQITKEFMTTTSCDADIRNEMAIAFLNSGIEHHDHRHRSKTNDHNPMSPCMAHYSTRLAVGTHAVSWKDMEWWNSGEARSTYMHDNAFTMKAARYLTSCLTNRCCPQATRLGLSTISWWDNDISSNVCFITEGDHGETIVPFTGPYAQGP